MYQSLAAELKKENAKGSVTAIRCDVRKEEDIMKVFERIREDFGVLHVCINSAGVGHNAPLLTGDPSEWRELLEVHFVITEIHICYNLYMIRTYKDSTCYILCLF